MAKKSLKNEANKRFSWFNTRTGSALTQAFKGLYIYGLITGLASGSLLKLAQFDFAGVVSQSLFQDLGVSAVIAGAMAYYGYNKKQLGPKMKKLTSGALGGAIGFALAGIMPWDVVLNPAQSLLTFPASMFMALGATAGFMMSSATSLLTQRITGPLNFLVWSLPWRVLSGVMVAGLVSTSMSGMDLGNIVDSAMQGNLVSEFRLAALEGESPFTTLMAFIVGATIPKMMGRFILGAVRTLGDLVTFNLDIKGELNELKINLQRLGCTAMGMVNNVASTYLGLSFGVAAGAGLVQLHGGKSIFNDNATEYGPMHFISKLTENDIVTRFSEDGIAAGFSEVASTVSAHAASMLHFMAALPDRANLERSGFENGDMVSVYTVAAGFTLLAYTQAMKFNKKHGFVYKTKKDEPDSIEKFALWCRARFVDGKKGLPWRQPS